MRTIDIRFRLAELLQLDVPQIKLSLVHGGDTHNCFKVATQKRNLFLKVTSDSPDLLISEFESLNLMQSYCPNSYPAPLLCENIDSGAFLLMSYHSIEPLDEGNASKAGRALGSQHEIHDQKFGWMYDNYIGASPQINTRNESWLGFFNDCRLGPQLASAVDNGLGRDLTRKIEVLMHHLDRYIDDSVIEPSLVHGDLWSGNLAYEKARQRSIFYDPAPYFGDALTDIAMTELFGRLPQTFYREYSAHNAVAERREAEVKAIYKLYHGLNHFNLFGSSYRALVSDLCSSISL